MTNTLTVLPSQTQEKAQAWLKVPSPDGAWLAIADPQEHTVEIVAAGGKPWCTYAGHQDGLYRRQGTIQALTWSPDGQWLASASSTGSVHVWTRRGIHQRTVQRAGDQLVKALHWNQDGLQLRHEDEENASMNHEEAGDSERGIAHRHSRSQRE